MNKGFYITGAVLVLFMVTCFFKPESQYNEDSIDHVYRKTILLLDVCYKDSTILSSIFERKGFQETNRVAFKGE
jgi:hypothetical protein